VDLFSNPLISLRVVRYARFMDATIEQIEKMWKSHTSKEDFVERLDAFTRQMQVRGRRRFRLDRARILAAAEGNARFEAALTVFIQAYTLGRAVEDYNDIHPLDDGRWADLIGRIVRNVLLEPDA